MKAIAYIRTSTKDQLEMYGPDRQREAIRAWARSGGHRVLEEIVEDVSGTVPADLREGWQQAVSAACERADGIVVADLSRLSRDLIEQELALRDLTHCGSRMFSTSSEEQRTLDDPHDPQRQLVRQIVGAVNAYDRAMIVKRMQAGRQIKKAQGGYAGGQPPFGWRGGDASRGLVPHPDEQDVLRRMHALAAVGRSTREIAATINAEGLRTRRGGDWSSPLVSKYLREGRLAEDAHPA